ncbi:MAG: hypothetical protein QOI20_3109 [Acidimicrobiaceae bacterium]|nr:hypothetical protein [Acidimicrobiaceae bacterium]
MATSSLGSSNASRSPKAMAVSTTPLAVCLRHESNRVAGARRLESKTGSASTGQRYPPLVQSDSGRAPATDNADADLAARTQAAAALRRLGHALVGHHVDPESLVRLAAHVETWLPELESAPTRRRAVGDMKRRLFEAPIGDGPDLEHFPDCVVSGPANPMGIAVDLHRDGDDAVALVSLGAAFEGAPGRAHGGIVAAVFDDVMGLVLKMVGTPAYTGELTVRYLAPTPIGERLEFRAWLANRDGRKLFIEAEAYRAADRVQVASARAVFIAIDWR